MSEYKTADELLELREKNKLQKREKEEEQALKEAPDEILRIEKELQEGRDDVRTMNEFAANHFLEIGLTCYEYLSMDGYFIRPQKRKQSWIKKLFSRG